MTVLEDNEPVEVTLRVSVPASTLWDATIRLVGNAPELALGIIMTQQPGNPWMYQATVSLSPEDSLDYGYA